MAPECAIAPAEEDGNGTPVEVRNGEIELSIAVEVRDGHGLRGVSRGVVVVAAERAVAPAEKHGHRVAALIRGYDVLLAVAVQVSDGHPFGEVPGAAVH